MVYLRKKKSTYLSTIGSGALKEYHPAEGAIDLLIPKLKSSVLSVDLVDFNARPVGSPITPRYDMAVYNKKDKIIAHRARTP